MKVKFTAKLGFMKLNNAAAGPPKMDGVACGGGLMNANPLEKGILAPSRILAFRDSQTVWKGKKTGHWEREDSPGS